MKKRVHYFLCQCQFTNENTTPHLFQICQGFISFSKRCICTDVKYKHRQGFSDALSKGGGETQELGEYNIVQTHWSWGLWGDPRSHTVRSTAALTGPVSKVNRGTCPQSSFWSQVFTTRNQFHIMNTSETEASPRKWRWAGSPVVFRSSLCFCLEER